MTKVFTCTAFCLCPKLAGKNSPRSLGTQKGGGFRKGTWACLFCSLVHLVPFALIKHLEHERRQITASYAGVPVRLCFFFFSFSQQGPQGTLPVFHRAGCDMGAVTGGAPEARAALLHRVAFDSLSPGARSSKRRMPRTPDPKTSQPLDSGLTLVMGTGMSTLRILGA